MNLQQILQEFDEKFPQREVEGRGIEDTWYGVLMMELSRKLPTGTQSLKVRTITPFD